MSETEIKVPNIGDFKDVEVIEVLVSEGQSIQKNDALITIESDKSSVEIPSNLEGKIKNLKIKVGDKVSEGDLILTIESSSEVKNEEVKEKPEIEKKITYDLSVLEQYNIDYSQNTAELGNGNAGNWDSNNMSVIAYIYNTITKEIVQVEEAYLNK